MAKHHLFLLSIFILLFANLSIAQTANESEIPRYKWEIGTGVFINQQDFSSLSSGLIAKRHMDKAGRKHAYRFGFNLFASSGKIIFDTLNYQVNPTSIVPNINFSVALGHEWQQQSGQFMFFYGGDISMSYYWENIDYKFLRAPYLPSYWKMNRIGTGIRGFFGAKFFIIPRLSVSAETSLSLLFAHTRIKREIYNENGSGEIVGKLYRTDNVFNLSYLPLSVFYVSYHF